jgi:predicted Zn-dependent peptidase
MHIKSQFNKTILPNGLTVITENVPGARSIALGVWVTVGSRDEVPETSGVSHFIEHMIFKGTQRRSAFDIAKTFDRMGGFSNAFTSRETTCFHARVLDIHLDTITDLLSDIVLNSRFDETEVERERQVILQEISMVEDTPDDHVHELFNSFVW